jgi:phosphoenolpyruvate-protein phosphotransferase
MIDSADVILKVGSPLRGWCGSLDDSPDPVFSGRVLGEGVSIDPLVGELRAPFDGLVVTVPDSRHAINLRAENGAELLIHVGIDSVNMAGDGFEVLVSAQEQVKRGQLLLKFDLEKVLRGAASLRTPVLLLQNDGFAAKAIRLDGPVDFGDEIFEICNAASKVSAAEDDIDSPEVSTIVAVGLEHGIHARPAAALIEAIKPLDAKVTCNHDDKPPANAASAVALMSLGVNYGDRVTISARGPDAAIALERASAALAPLELHAISETTIGETVEDSSPVESAVQPLTDGALVRAQPASPGLGHGKSFLLELEVAEARTSAGSVDQEQKVLREALEKVRHHLDSLTASDDATRAGIATAHLALLDDPLLTEKADSLVLQGKAAPAAWEEATDSAIEILCRVDDVRMKERADDLRDIHMRVQRAFAGMEPGKGPEVPQGVIILADNLLPSQLMELDCNAVNGICLASGGATSHVAILAMSLGVPMLVAAGNEVLSIANGTNLLLDSELGEMQVGPEETSIAEFEARLRTDRQRQLLEQEAAHDECRTSDGVRIHMNANLGSAQDALAAVKAGAEGCGLLRTEFAFMERASAPGVDEQLAIYSQISEILGDRPMVVRTLDAGGDKPIRYIDQALEENPALGVRGIRLTLDQPDLLKTQLQALAALERPTPLQVMIPMVSSVQEIQSVRQLLEQVQAAGVSNAAIQLGIMIETPAAALIAKQLASMVDFFSIGTNDLTQYTLCMDRGEPKLADQLDVLHPAVLRLIRSTVEAADSAGISAAVCGGAAGDMLAAPLLLGLGVRELSMPASLVARQKARLREVSIKDCEALASRALEMNTSTEIRAMMRNFVVGGKLPQTGE